MSRTRSERRALTHKATARRRKTFDNGVACTGKLAANGEARSCNLCCTCNEIDRNYHASFEAKKLSAYILAQR